MSTECFSCRQTDAVTAPPAERILVTDHWRVAHAFDTDLPGWLVLLPRRHVTALAELRPDEAAEIGPLLQRISGALRQRVGAGKTYVMLFAEAEGFAHLHFHVVPRMPDQPDAERGPRIFARLGLPPERRLAEADVDELCRSLSAALGDPGLPPTCQGGKVAAAAAPSRPDEGATMTMTPGDPLRDEDLETVGQASSTGADADSIDAGTLDADSTEAGALDADATDASADADSTDV